MDCELLRMDIIIYILSIAFQVAGAVLLIIKYWGKTESRIIAEYFPEIRFGLVNKSGKITMKKKRVQACARNVYHNRMSFLYIAIGYILSIFGNVSGVCKVCVLAFAVVCTLLLIVLERLISWVISVIVYREDIDKDYSEVKNIVPVGVVEF